jgi:hypothetical protein
MSLRFFTVLAHSLQKKDDLDLCHAHIHSLRGSCSFAFHVVARKHALTVSPHGQRCGAVPSAVHPLPTGPCRVEGTKERTTPACRLRIKRIPVQTPSVEVSVKRHLSRIFPCLTRSLARCLSRALRQLRGSASHFVRPADFGFQKIFSARLRTERGRKDFPNLPKKHRLALGAGHLPSLRARVSRVRTGQIQTGEKQWHSMKTTRN